MLDTGIGAAMELWCLQIICIPNESDGFVGSYQIFLVFLIFFSFVFGSVCLGFMKKKCPKNGKCVRTQFIWQYSIPLHNDLLFSHLTANREWIHTYTKYADCNALIFTALMGPIFISISGSALLVNFCYCLRIFLCCFPVFIPLFTFAQSFLVIIFISHFVLLLLFLLVVVIVVVVSVVVFDFLFPSFILFLGNANKSDNCLYLPFHAVRCG